MKLFHFAETSLSKIVMSIFKDIPPTAGLPVSAGELIAAYRNRHDGDLLAQDFRQQLGSPFTAITCSGTSALYIICEALKELSTKKTILAPSFICPLVAFAIRRAGFTIALYDIGPHDFNGDACHVKAACAANPDIAAIVINHLGGIPCDMVRYESVIKDYGLVVIEDCAQSFGALYKGNMVGTLGDFSFFSLAAGKGLTLYEGGVLIANRQEHAALISAQMRRLEKPDFFMEAQRVLELLGYGLFYRPLLFWFVFTLPQLFWTMRGDEVRALREDFDTGFPMHSVSNFRKALGHVAFPRIAQAQCSQREKAAFYFDGLKDLRGISIVQEAPSDRATYPYVAVIFDDTERRNALLKRASHSGLGISQIYAHALPDYGYLRAIVPDMNSHSARLLAQRSVTLSTSPFLEKSDLAKTVEIMHNVLS
jgi:perosamine synthetase